jgi:hypothetical protein
MCGNVTFLNFNMSKNNKPAGQRSRVLSDHRKVGKKFVPPMMQDFNFQLVKFASQAIPELVWLAMLNDRFGWREGARLGVEMAKLALDISIEVGNEAKGSSSHKTPDLFAFSSAFGSLSDESKTQLVERMKFAGIWEPIIAGLAPLAHLYSEFPFTFVFAGAGILAIEEDMGLVKSVLLPLHDKYSLGAVSMYANAIYIAFATDRLKIVVDENEKSPMANFPAIQGYPATEESKMIAASVRASLLSMIGMSEISMDWSIHFWNRGLQLEQCVSRS